MTSGDPAAGAADPWWSRAAEVVALATLAVAQPLLDLFGANPEFFVASGADDAEIVLFALVVVLGVPAVGLAAEAVAGVAGGQRAAQAAHLGVLGVLGAAFGLALARQVGLESTGAMVPVALVVGIGVPMARQRVAALRLALRYLAALPVLVLVQFLVLSATGELIGQEEAEAVEGIDVGVDAPVVMVMFDELPVASLMDPDGTIAEERYPNFARLAQAGTWYRNAIAVAASTVRSVPSALTGLEPDDETTAPISAELPRNLFTLLGDEYRLDVHELLTDLCPDDLCVVEEELGTWARLRGTLGDAAVVYGHQVLPEGLRRDLPVIDQSWDGFLDQRQEVEVEPSDRLRDAFVEQGQGAFVEVLRETNPAAFEGAKGEPLLRAIEAAEFAPSSLFFAHDSFPHFVWERTPEGGLYDGEGGPPGTTDATWSEDGFLVRQGLQRHLLQVGYADTVLGGLIDRLEEAGLWDDALVVVAADHGIAFRPGSPTRQPTRDTLQEIFRVPLFVKAPGQVDGAVDDRVADLVDVLPTVVDLLEVDVDWAFDGRSLVGPPPTTDREEDRRPGTFVVPGGAEEAVRVARRNAQLLPYLGGWRDVARVGAHADLIGRDLGDLGGARARVGSGIEAEWALDEAEVLADFEPGRDPLPVVLHGRVGSAELDPVDLLVAVDGRLVGASRLGSGDGARRFRVLIDHAAVRAGANDLALYAVTRNGGIRVLRPLVATE